MHVLIFGATGMIGHGALVACQRDPGVERITVIGRRSTGTTHPKLTEHVRSDVSDLSGLETELATVDACLFCLGVSAAGLDEQRYTALTHDLTLDVARTLVRLNPRMAFAYVSGRGTDPTEEGRMMWARVKGRTENDLRKLGFRSTVMVRPSVLQPVDGAQASTRWYRVMYRVFSPLVSVLRRALPREIATSTELGQAMLAAVRAGAPTAVLETADIVRLARAAPG